MRNAECGTEKLRRAFDCHPRMLQAGIQPDIGPVSSKGSVPEPAGPQTHVQ